jgi:hypothetical protein
MSKTTGISFFNTCQNRGCIVITTQEGFVIQVLRYEDGKTKSATITLDSAQIQSLLDYINKNHDGPF